MRRPHRSIEITDRSSVGEARRIAMAAAESLGFNDDRRSDIGIVATEAANNVLIHAGKGQLLVCPQAAAPGAALDLIGLDRGPGIREMSRAFEDGFSTAGTAGHGLGAMERLSDLLSVYSAPGLGTALFSRFQQRPPVDPAALGVVSIAQRGETLCGDSYVALPGGERSLYMVVDGLGHGANAHEAAEEAVQALREAPEDSPAQILARAHDALKKTRGAAMSVAAVNHGRQTVSYAGVGNIAAFLFHAGSMRSMVSQNGTVGMVLPTLREYTYPFEPGSLLVMHSDGLSSRSSISGYPGLGARPPGLVAGVLYRDFSRGRDDATVLTAVLKGARN